MKQDIGSLPWYTYEQPAPYDEREKTQVIARKDNGLTIAVIGGFSPIEQRATAAFILRACNSHEALINELMAALCFVEDAEKSPGFKPGVVAKRIDSIRAVLKRAGAI